MNSRVDLTLFNRWESSTCILVITCFFYDKPPGVHFIGVRKQSNGMQNRYEDFVIYVPYIISHSSRTIVSLLLFVYSFFQQQLLLKTLKRTKIYRIVRIDWTRKQETRSFVRLSTSRRPLIFFSFRALPFASDRWLYQTRFVFTAEKWRP